MDLKNLYNSGREFMSAAFDPVNIIGMIGGCFTTISFLPQVIRVWKTHSTKDISLAMFLLFVAGVLFWLVYGILTKAWPVIIANFVTLILTLIILVYKIIYK
jgi:MtN3 and saliva related transmembrane protein